MKYKVNQTVWVKIEDSFGFGLPEEVRYEGPAKVIEFYSGESLKPCKCRLPFNIALGNGVSAKEIVLFKNEIKYEI